MSNNKKHTGGMWEYLDSTGVLERGIDEEIKEAKKQYRKIYFTKQKRKQRATKREFTLGFFKDKVEFFKVEYSAKLHKMKISEFLKLAVLAYINKTYIVPDRIQIAELELILSQCLNEIQSIVKQKEKYSYEREQKYERIECRIEKLETEIKTVLQCPHTIEELVLKKIEEKPSLKEQLLVILSNNDHQNQIT